MIRREPCARQAAITLCVPWTLIRSYSSSGPQMPALAAVWKTVWQPSTARSTTRGVGDVSLDLLDPELLQMGVKPPAQAPDRQPALHEQLDQGRAQKAAAAGHQHLAEIRGPHDSLLEAQTASFSRKILALWRISTGKEG